MTMAKPPKKSSTIVVNKKAKFDYLIENKYEAGLVLQGWEVKALRTKNVQLKESYIKIKNGEIFLFGCHITPLASASTHINPDPIRTRKVLLHKSEISKLIGLVERKGYTLLALSLFWKKGKAKVDIGLAKGKKQHDKRATIKERDWKRDQERLIKNRY